ncbi:glycosyltransferase [Candidatus Woesebacteria bacterium]|nr:glycosyltransferase [Candidatus Woesebacteria bacterium]MCD8545930.1 glycosyltransferase [Candidatus Woesebacteria bacterium]
MQAAKHPFVFLINNDVSPLSQDIRERILEPFVHDPELFAVGCAEVATREKDASISGRGTGGFRRGLLVHWYDSNQNNSTTLWTSGGSMAFDRAKFLEIGGMDTLFYPAYEEDRDLSYRAVKHGWKIKFLPQAKVLHQHETTNTSVFGRKNMEIMSWKNQFLIVWKNITDRNMLLQHVLWLPYHLTITNWKTGGAVVRGLWRALQQFSEVRRKRRQVARLWERSDRAVLRMAQ